MSVSKLLDISKQGLLTYQAAINVSSHNIANAKDPNYSRQRANTATVNLDVYGKTVIGGGVKLSDIQRMRNSIADSQYRYYNQQNSDANKRSELLGQVEILFSETDDLGLGNLTNQFLNSWNALAVTPNSSALRGEVVQSAQQFANKIQTVNDGIQSTKSETALEARNTVSRINALLKDIQSLNKQIVMVDAARTNSNDLMDARDAAVDELSSLADIKINKDDRGSYNVSIGGVFGADAYSFNEFIVTEDSGRLEMETTDGFATARLNGGEMNALLDTYNVTLPKYQQKTDDYVNGLMNSINALHAAGNTLHTIPLTGIDFFSGYTNGKLTINQNIIDDANYIAASADGTSGNGDVALSIYALAQDTTILGGKTFAGYYSDLVSEIGAEQVSYNQFGESTGLALEQIEVQRADVSGVSTDEEMVDIMAFQKAYEASAKLLSIADEMVTTLLNMV